MLKLGRYSLYFTVQAGRLKASQRLVASKRTVSTFRDKVLYNFSSSRSFLSAQERRLSIAVYNSAMGGKGSKAKGSMEVTGDDKHAAGAEVEEGQAAAVTTATEESQYVEAVVGKASEFGDNE